MAARSGVGVGSGVDADDTTLVVLPAALARFAPGPGAAKAPKAGGTTGLGVGIDGWSACSPLWVSDDAPAAGVAAAAAAAEAAAASPAGRVGAGPALLPIGVAVGRADAITESDQRHTELTTSEYVPARP